MNSRYHDPATCPGARSGRCERLLRGVAILILALAPSLAGAQWYWQNPLPQPYTLRSLSFLDADTGIAAGDQGTILKTTDGGATWALQASGISLEGNMSRVQFIDATTITASGGYIPADFSAPTGFIVRSTDGGVNWDIQVTTPGTLLYDVEFRDTDVGTAVGVNYTTIEATILRTTDGGATWQTQSAGYLGLMTAVNFVDANVGFAAGLDLVNGTSVILRSNDGGANWTPQTVASDQQLNDIAFRDLDHGIAVGNAGVVFTTSDGGANWTEHASGTALNLHRIALAPGGAMYIAGGDSSDAGTILKSTDAGSTWSAQNFDRSVEGIQFRNADTGTATGVGGEILRTSDAGQTWTSQQRTVTDNALQAVSFADPLTGTAVGTDGTIVRTTDGGNNWFNQSSGTDMTLYGVSTPSVQFGIAVGADIIDIDRQILATTDGGETWTDRTPSDLPMVPLLAVACPEVGICTVVGYCGMILRTDDGGLNWTTQREPACATQPPLQAVHFIDAQTGTAVGQQHILHTTDAGATWTEQTNPTDQVLRGVVFTDADNGFAVGGHQANAGTILHTTDGGANWTVQRNDLATSPRGIDFIDANHGTLVTLGGEIFRTADAGATWLLDQDVSANLYGLVAFDADTATSVGSGHQNGIIIGRSAGPTFSIALDPVSAAVCKPDAGTEQLSVDVGVHSMNQYAGTVALSTPALTGISSDILPASVSAPGTSTWTLTVDADAAAGHHVLALSGTDGTLQRVADLRLDVIDPALAAELLEPMDAAMNVPLQPTFTWTAIAAVDAYHIEIATDAAFSEIVAAADVEATGFTPPAPLIPGTQYYWRVRGAGTCTGAWSSTFGFTTEAMPIAQVDPTTIEFEIAAGGSANVGLDIGNGGSGELIWNIETAQEAAPGCTDPSGVSWLDADPASGSTAAGETDTVQVEVGGAALIPGEHAASLCITSNDPEQPLIVVPVHVTVTPGAPANVTALGGDGQSATVGNAFAAPLSVQVRDASNNPLANIEVTFEAPDSGASAMLSAQTVPTDANGYAAVNATANDVVGSYEVTASVDGVATGATFTLTNLAAHGDVAVAILADRDHVRPGQLLNYLVTLNNEGPDTLHDASIASALSPLLDIDAATWQCIGPPASGCTASGSGDIADTGLTIAAGGGASYLLTAPVRLDADGLVESAATGHADTDTNPGNDSASATSAIVVYRNGFEAYGDGAGGLLPLDGRFDAESRISLVPAATSPRWIETMLVAAPESAGLPDEPGTAGFRVERSLAGNVQRMRLAATDEEGREYHSVWLDVTDGEQPNVVLVDNDSAAPPTRNVMLIVPGGEVHLRVPAAPSAYRIYSTADARIEPMQDSD